MKFSGVNFERVKVYEKLFPINFIPRKIFATFRPYSIQNHNFYSGNINRKKVEAVYHSAYGRIGMAQYVDMAFKNSIDLDVDRIRADTFSWWGREDFGRMLRQFYGRFDVMGILVFMEVTEVVDSAMSRIGDHLALHGEYLDTLGVDWK